MAKTVGNIVVQLQANSAGFNRDMRKAQQQVSSTSAGINKSLGSMERSFKSLRAKTQLQIKSFFSLRKVVGALLGTGGLGLLINRSLQAADAISKTADKIGISTKALQEYQFAASQSGVETSTLNMALQRFTRRVAEAAQGKGELKDVLEQYGIAVRDAGGRTRKTTDILEDLAEVVKNTESSAEQLRISFKAFDSEGAALVNMWRDGKDGLKKYADEANRFGIILEDAVTRNAAKANDALDKMGRIISATFTKVVAENADSLAAAVEKLATAMSKVAVFAGLRSIIGTTMQGMAMVQKGQLDYITFINAGWRERQKMVDDILKKQQQLGAISQHEAFRLSESTRGVPTGGVTPRAAPTTITPVVDRITATTPKVARQVRNEAEEVAKQYTEAFNDAVMLYSGEIESPGLTAARIFSMEYEHRINSVTQALDEFYTEIDAAAAATTTAADDMAGGWTKLGRSISSVTNGMSNAFTEFIMTGRLDFKEMAASIIGDLIRIQAQAAAMQIFGGLSGGLAGLFGGGAAPITMQHGGYIGESVFGVGRESGRSYEFHPHEFVVPIENNVQHGERRGGVNNFNIVVQAPEGRVPRESINQMQTALARSMQRQVHRAQ